MDGVELCIKMSMKRFCHIICPLLFGGILAHISGWISSEMLLSFQINSLHILNSDDLPAGYTLFTSSQKLSSTSEGHKKWSLNECFSHLPIFLLPAWPLPGKSTLLNDKIVRSFDLCFSALS